MPNKAVVIPMARRENPPSHDTQPMQTAYALSVIQLGLRIVSGLEATLRHE